MCTAPWTHPTHGPIKCGQCMECRLAYSRQWAIRITHEARMHAHNSFVTLTYDDAHLPPYGQLVKSDLQKFFKRLRHHGPFKYVACGEYGDKHRRPHFHIALFGMDFNADRIEFGTGVMGDTLYISKTLHALWPMGSFPYGHSIGSISFQSAAYIGRYITKRITGAGASPLPLARIDDELIMPNPEFLCCSKGIGSGWFDKYFRRDSLPHGRIITDQGSPAPIPRYYKEKLKHSLIKRSLALKLLENQNVDYEKRFIEQLPHRRSARAVIADVNNGIFTRDVSSFKG